MLLAAYLKARIGPGCAKTEVFCDPQSLPVSWRIFFPMLNMAVVPRRLVEIESGESGVEAALRMRMNETRCGSINTTRSLSAIVPDRASLIANQARFTKS